MLKTTKKKIYIGLIVLFAASLAIFIYLNFFYTNECQNYECWEKYIKKCSRASFVNEASEASWGYKILGKADDKCSVEVTLLIAKQGILGIDKYTGDKMTCYYQQGRPAYLEQDYVNACTGLLKEDLQTLMLNKYRTYIIENLGKVAEGLEQPV
ncbi:hypothetical protein J4229_01565 [Candidatus Pacearchaeota archaeon]|nr:hypothetical protein [Candidatus Pacearchaeota archaeon]